MKRSDIVRYGATTLFAAEGAIDIAIHEASVLMSELTRLRAEGKISAIVGQDAFETCSETISGLTQARKSIVMTHKHLDDVKNQIGCRTVAFGGDIYKVPRVPAQPDAIPG
jgi:hypothetical protein